MAWIETAEGGAVNLDNVSSLGLVINELTFCDRTTECWVYTDAEDDGVKIYKVFVENILEFGGGFNPDTKKLRKVGTALNRVIQSVAQIARGSAYISQADLNKMFKDEFVKL